MGVGCLAGSSQVVCVLSMLWIRAETSQFTLDSLCEDGRESLFGDSVDRLQIGFVLSLPFMKHVNYNWLK